MDIEAIWTAIGKDGGGKYGPYLTDQDGNPLIPEIRNGYYGRYQGYCRCKGW